MNCSPIRTFTLLLLFIALVTTLYEVRKKFTVGKYQKVVTVKSSVVRYTPDDQFLGSDAVHLENKGRLSCLIAPLRTGFCISAQPQQAMAKAGEQAWGDGKKEERPNPSSDAKAQCCRCSLRGGASTQKIFIRYTNTAVPPQLQAWRVAQPLTGSLQAAGGRQWPASQRKRGAPQPHDDHRRWRSSAGIAFSKNRRRCQRLAYLKREGCTEELLLLPLMKSNTGGCISNDDELDCMSKKRRLCIVCMALRNLHTMIGVALHAAGIAAWLSGGAAPDSAACIQPAECPEH